KQGVRNALYTLELMGLPQVPVHAGCAAPLHRPLETAQHVHGVDGMGDIGLPEPSTAAASAEAVDALLTASRSAPGELTLVTLGPLTNIATALRRDAGVLARFKRVFLMAGAADGVGNVSPAGEYNVWADPEAARLVLAAEADLTFIGWDVSRRRAVLAPEEQARLGSMPTPYAAFMQGINRCVDEWARSYSGLDGYDLPDPIAMAVALRPHLATRTLDTHVAVCVEEPARGMLLVDRRHRPLRSNASVVVDVDEAEFKEMLFAVAGRPGLPGTPLPAALAGGR
ncbi:MAG: nucleoside hydrolase, partial [Actinomycetia bacterium]|nr:nucleoside hydrolase [Actinomycetes bacterium]